MSCILNNNNHYFNSLTFQIFLEFMFVPKDLEKVSEIQRSIWHEYCLDKARAFSFPTRCQRRSETRLRGLIKTFLKRPFKVRENL